MPRKCSVYRCRTGYDSAKGKQLKISVYSFPKGKDECNAWLASLPNPRKFTKVTVNMGVCALHFPHDVPMVKRRRHLAPGVPPSIFSHDISPTQARNQRLPSLAEAHGIEKNTEKEDEKPDVHKSLWQIVHTNEHPAKDYSDEKASYIDSIHSPVSTTLDLHCESVEVKQEICDEEEQREQMHFLPDCDALPGEQNLQDVTSAPHLHKHVELLSSEVTEHSQEEASQANTNGDDGVFPYHCSFCRNVYYHSNAREIHMKTSHREKYLESDVGMNHDMTEIHKLGTLTSELPGPDCFTCKECTKSFTSKRGLKIHSKVIHNKQFFCVLCGKGYHSQDVLNLHVRSHKLYKHLNDKVISGENLMSRHMTTHTKPFKCKVCNKGFSRETELNIHKRQHTGEELYKCTFCDKCFSRRRYLTVHVRSHTGERPYKCSDCSWAFKDKSDLNRHRKTHTLERPHKCDLCNAAFKSKSNMKAHRENHIKRQGEKAAGLPRIRKWRRSPRDIPDSEKKFICEVCSEGFVTKQGLNLHLLRHSGEKPHRCHVCQKAFFNKYSLKAHEIGHTRTSPFQCGKCGKAFSRQSELEIHERRHSGERPFTCGVCPSRFCSRVDLRSHQQSHSGLKPYRCKLCDKSFAKKKYLWHHGLTHSEERRFKCHLCNKGFKEKSSLRRHSKVHERRQEYNCDHCDRTFSCEGHLNIHMQGTHKAVMHGQENEDNGRERENCPGDAEEIR